MKVKPGPSLLKGDSFIEKLQASQAVNPRSFLEEKGGEEKDKKKNQKNKKPDLFWSYAGLRPATS